MASPDRGGLVRDGTTLDTAAPGHAALPENAGIVPFCVRIVGRRHIVSSGVRIAGLRHHDTGLQYRVLELYASRKTMAIPVAGKPRWMAGSGGRKSVKLSREPYKTSSNAKLVRPPTGAAYPCPTVTESWRLGRAP